MFRLVMFFCFLGMLAPAQAQEATPDPLPVDVFQARWNNQAINAYYLEAEYTTDDQTINVDLWVEDNSIQNAWVTCAPVETCNLERVYIHEFSVNGLFSSALQNTITELSFHPVYGFPMYLQSSAGWMVRVIDFQQIESASLDARVTATAIARMTTSPTPPPTLNVTATPYAPSSSSTQTVSLEAITPPEDELQDYLLQARAQWQAMNITSYTISLTEVDPWSGLSLRLSVQDNRVTHFEAECLPGWMAGPCSVFAVDAPTYTISGLFQRAEEAIDVIYDATWESDVVAFSRAAGVPVDIFFDQEEVVDEEWSLIVDRLVVFLPAPTPTASP